MVSTIVVTGGGTGIGRAAATLLAGQASHVTVAGRRPEPLGVLAAEHDLARDLGPHGGAVLGR